MLLPNIFEAEFGAFLKYKKMRDSSLRFLHGSDIHLGSHQYSNEYRAEDFLRAFHEILRLAIIHKVDFILLVGDVFTSLEMLPGLLTKIIEILTDFQYYTKQSIPIIAIEGNHDIRKFSRGVRFSKRGQSWLKLLTKLGLLILLDADVETSSSEIFLPYDNETKKGGKIQIKNTIIYGTHYLGEKPISSLSKIRKAINNDDGLFHILLQHFGIDGQMDDIPGIELKYIQPLRHRVHYLALGHFHKQFIIDDWIYNPGSSEAASTLDHSYKRGIFLSEVLENDHYKTNINYIQLTNRKYKWQTVHLPLCFRNKQELSNFLIKKLKATLVLRSNLEPENPMMPVLLLVLKGKKPVDSCKIDKKSLSKTLIENFPIVDVRIFLKFTNSSQSIEKYLKF